MRILRTKKFYQMTNDKHFSLLRNSVIYGQKSFITLTPGSNVIKKFLSVIYEFLCQARVFLKQDWKSLPARNTLAYYEKS
jgi:hypothetical protein